MNEISEDKLNEINNNWETFCRLAQGIEAHSDAINNILDIFGERLASCPSSIKTEAGSLVSKNLRTLKACISMNKKFKFNLRDESMLLCCLFNDLGLIGDFDNDLFLPEDNWHKERGFLFKYNKKLAFMRRYDRTLWLLSTHGVAFTQDEFLSFLSSSGQNDNYKLQENKLGFTIHAAMRISEFQDKDKNEKEN